MSELITEDWKLKSQTVVKLYRTRSVLVYVLADEKRILSMLFSVLTSVKPPTPLSIRVSVKCGNVECGMRKACNQGVLYCLLFAPAGSIIFS